MQETKFAAQVWCRITWDLIVAWRLALCHVVMAIIFVASCHFWRHCIVWTLQLEVGRNRWSGRVMENSLQCHCLDWSSSVDWVSGVCHICALVSMRGMWNLSLTSRLQTIESIDVIVSEAERRLWVQLRLINSWAKWDERMKPVSRVNRFNYAHYRLKVSLTPTTPLDWSSRSTTRTIYNSTSPSTKTPLSNPSIFNSCDSISGRIWSIHSEKGLLLCFETGFNDTILPLYSSLSIRSVSRRGNRFSPTIPVKSIR